MDVIVLYYGCWCEINGGGFKGDKNSGTGILVGINENSRVCKIVTKNQL